MKRVLIALTALALAAGAVAQVDYDSVDPSGQSVLFWHQHTGAREESLNEIVADFNATNPYGITVIAENQGSYSDIFNKMLVLMGTSDVPDLVVAYQNQAATYQLVDGLIDIWPLVNSAKWGFGEEELGDFFQGFLQSDVNPAFDNALLGFPPHRSMEVMYYNEAWLAELGADGPPRTPAEFAELACKAVEQPYSGAVGGGRSLGYEISLDASRFASWTFAFGGNVFDYEAERYSFVSDAAPIAAMYFLQDLSRRGCMDIVTETRGDQANFGVGTTLFAVASSSGLPFWGSAVEAGADFPWSVAPLPHIMDEPVMNLYGASVSMSAGLGAERQVATWLFLKYYTSPEAQARWARASNYFPARASVAAGLGDYFDANPAYGTAFALLPYGIAEPPVPGYDFVRSLIQTEMAAILDGADVISTLTAAEAEANAILVEQLAELD